MITFGEDVGARAVRNMHRSYEGHPLSDLRSGRDKVAASDIDKVEGRLNDPNPPSGCCAEISSEISSIDSELSDHESRISTLESMLADASIDASCNGDGTITVTLTFGGG